MRHAHIINRLTPRALLPLTVLLLVGCMGGDQAPDPVAQDFAVAYVKRPLPVNNQGALIQPDLRRLLRFNPGGDLYVRERAAPSAPERNVTFGFTGGLGDVRDVEASYDGTRLLFSMRGPEIEGADDDEQPTWNIWEYDLVTDELRRIIPGDITAEEGQDIAPHYLPDGRIVFASTRQRQSRAILLDEGKDGFAALDEDRAEPALTLHVMDADGDEIQQISFNQSHDLDPSVLSNGAVLFSRWDHMGGRNEFNLYTVGPDGSALRILYGAHSHATGTTAVPVHFSQPREMADGRVMALLRPLTGTHAGGDLVIIDVANYIDNDQPTAVNEGILSGDGQVPATQGEVRTDPAPSPGGRFRAAYPLWDGTHRAMVSWSPCRLIENEAIVPCTEERLAAPDAQEAPPLYGIYVYDPIAGTQLPIVAPEEGVMFSEVIAAHPRAMPAPHVPPVVDTSLAAEQVGLLNIRSVYDVDGIDTATPDIPTLADPAQTPSADARPARFLRIVKAVGIPEDVPNAAFGRSAAQKMREIIGYAPIEPDGSVKVQVPANVALAISVLDKDGRRIGQRHQNWLQVRPGEELRCNGCHSHASGRPHGRPEGPASAYPGAAFAGYVFPNSNSDYWADAGETMAEARARASCQTDNCAMLQPSVDIVYADVWTDANVRAPDASFDYSYADLASPAPVSVQCQSSWSSGCRTVINYEQHIHPLWGLDRGANTCIACHSTDDMGMLRVPAAQLDLSDGPSSDQPAHFKSYRELLFPDNAQEIVDGALQDVLIPDGFETDANGDLVLDENGDPVPRFRLDPVQPSMSTVSARASTRFFSRFDPGGDHEGLLSAAELRLIAEWLDIGAQYYNNPFDVPTQ